MVVIFVDDPSLSTQTGYEVTDPGISSSSLSRIYARFLSMGDSQLGVGLPRIHVFSLSVSHIPSFFHSFFLSFVLSFLLSDFFQISFRF